VSGTTNAARQTLIYNEQTKLIANALDRASTVVGAGSVWPLINLAKPSSRPVDGAALLQFLFGVAFFLFFAGVLHYLARRALRGLL
jgi:hypothetical protein